MRQLSTCMSGAVLLVGAAFAAPVYCAEEHEHEQHSVASATVEAAQMSVGEIKKVDRDAGKITIKHGPLLNLNMPSMTMVFKVKEAAMLETVKAGDKVHFVAEKINGALTLTKLDPAK